MFSYGKRYLVLVAAVMAIFMNFVACGAQFYKLSLEDDTHLQDDDAQDPASPHYGLHSPDGWSRIPIHFRVSNELTEEQQQGLIAAMAIWEMAVGRQLFVFEGTQDITGDSFKDLFSSLEDDVNGHYLDDDWAKTNKSSKIIATTIWTSSSSATAILTADIRFNSNYYYMADALNAKPVDSREIVDMQTLALHELGHYLGLRHIDPAIDGSSIMNPSVYIGQGLANRRLSKGDIKRVQKIYGCIGDACNAEKLMAQIDALQRQASDEEFAKSLEAAKNETTH